MSEAPSTAAVDANVILRYVLQDHETLSGKANGIFEAVEAGRTVVTCDPVTLAEVVFVLSSHYKVPSREIASGLEPILKFQGFRIPGKDRYLRALALFAGPVKHFGDACCCAAALDGQEGRLYSFDRDLSRVEGVSRSEAPF